MNALLSLLYDPDEEGNWSFEDLIEYGYLVLLEVREGMAMGGGGNKGFDKDDEEWLE